MDTREYGQEKHRGRQDETAGKTGDTEACTPCPNHSSQAVPANVRTSVHFREWRTHESRVRITGKSELRKKYGHTALTPYALFARFDGTRGISLIAKEKCRLPTDLSTGNGDKHHLPEKAERTNGKRPFARISRDLPSYCTLPASSSS